MLTDQDIHDVLATWRVAREHPRWEGRLTPTRKPIAWHYGNPVFLGDNAGLGLTREDILAWADRKERVWKSRRAQLREMVRQQQTKERQA